MSHLSRSRRWFVAAGVLALSGVGATPAVLRAQAASGPTQVILVRHAEKATVGGDDPALSELGKARAADLAAALRSAPPSAIIVSSLQRTALTAADVVAATGVTPQAIPVAGGAAHIAAVASAVQKQTGTVLVVGHSNTVPAIIKALGGPSLPDICDATYSHLFVFTPARDGRAASLIVSRFGANEAAPPATCAGMIPK